MNRQQQLDLAIFNVGVERARREYAITPNAACLAHDCPELATDGDVVCRDHRKQRDTDAARKRRARREKTK